MNVLTCIVFLSCLVLAAAFLVRQGYYHAPFVQEPGLSVAESAERRDWLFPSVRTDGACIAAAPVLAVSAVSEAHWTMTIALTLAAAAIALALAEMCYDFGEGSELSHRNRSIGVRT